MTDKDLADKAKQLAKFYIDTNKLGDLPAMVAVVEHAFGYAFRIGYRSAEGAQQREAANATKDWS